ncbi:MAG: hypothetical protein ACI4MS_03580 [Candidatus Coproplasma sp.]
MKRSKILKTAISFLCVATMGVTAFAGCTKDSCEHIYEWTIDREATCSKEGERHGLCSFCGDVLVEKIPIDENAHAYGEWVIAEEPSETSTGKAVKTCTYNQEHVAEVPLPQITTAGTGYTVSTQEVVPTAINEGKQHLELEHELGTIVFDVVLPKRELKTVADAVTLASSLGDTIRTSNGYFKEGNGGTNWPFETYFGDNYTYINDTANMREYWYSNDENGDPYGVVSYNGATPIAMVGVDKNNILGINYQSGANTVTSFYGAEMGLKQAYNFAVQAESREACVGYRDTINKNRDGTVDVTFSFGYYEAPWFTRYNVEFTTFKSGAIKRLYIETVIVQAYLIAKTFPNGDVNAAENLYYKKGDYYTDENGDKVYMDKGDMVYGLIYPEDDAGNPRYMYDGDGKLVFATDENGEYIPYKDVNGIVITDRNGDPVKVPLDYNGNIPTTYYSDTQADHRCIEFTEQVLKKDDDVVEQNPYPADSLHIKDFEITSVAVNNVGTVNVVKGENGENDSVTLPTATGLTFNFKVNNQPASLASDPIEHIYVIDPTGNRIELNSNMTGNGHKYHIMYYYVVSAKNVVMNSQYAGEIQLEFVPKADKCRYVLNVNFERSAPTSLTAQANIYSTADGKVFYNWTNVSGAVSLYAGQSLQVRAKASASEEPYVSAEFTPSVTSGSSSAVSFTDNGDGTYSVVATNAGNYVIRLTSTLNSSVSCSISISVKAKPDIVKMLSGKSYSQNVSVLLDGSTPVKRELTATFNSDGTFTVEVVGNTAVYSYSVADGKLVTSWLSGKLSPSEKTFDFEFSIDEGYSLIVTHSTGFGTKTESVVLSLDIAEMLSGNTYSGNVNVISDGENTVNSQLTATFNNDGTLTVKVGDKTAEYKYSVTGSELITSLVKGDWGPQTSTYDFEFSFDRDFNVEDFSIETIGIKVSHSTGNGTAEETVTLSLNATQSE